MLAYQATFYFDKLTAQILPESCPKKLKDRFDLAVITSIKKQTPFLFEFSLAELHGHKQSDGENASLILNSETVVTNGKSQYSHGEFNIPFLFIKLSVSPDVFLPRRGMINTTFSIIEKLSETDTTGRTFLDLGCGSGLIGIALKKRFPQLRVVATDISTRAIKLAKKNAIANEVEIEFLVGDLFEPLKRRSVDFLAFYAPQSINNWETLTQYSEYHLSQISEPILAFESGPKGLDHLKRVCSELREKVKPHGIIWLSGRCMPEAINWLSPYFRVNAVTHPDSIRGHTFFFEKISD